MRIVAVDPSLTNTGIVAMDGDGRVIASDVAGYPLKADASHAERVNRVNAIANAIFTMMTEHGISVIAMEGPAYGATTRLLDVGGLSYAIWALPHQEVKVIPPLSARAAALGKGRPPDGVGVKSWVNQTLRSSFGEPKALRATNPALSDVLSNEHLRDALVVGYAALGLKIADPEPKAKPISRKAKKVS